MNTTKAALVVNCSLKALQNRSARLWDDTFLLAFCLPALSNLMKIPCMQPPFPLGASQKPSSQLALFCHGLGNQLESPPSPFWGFLSRVLSTSSSTSTPSNHHPFKRVGMRHAYPKSPDLTSLVIDWTMYTYIYMYIHNLELLRSACQLEPSVSESTNGAWTIAFVHSIYFASQSSQYPTVGFQKLHPSSSI